MPMRMQIVSCGRVPLLRQFVFNNVWKVGLHYSVHMIVNSYSVVHILVVSAVLTGVAGIFYVLTETVVDSLTRHDPELHRRWMGWRDSY